jgi:hypothetical protein
MEYLSFKILIALLFYLLVGECLCYLFHYRLPPQGFLIQYRPNSKLIRRNELRPVETPKLEDRHGADRP